MEEGKEAQMDAKPVQLPELSAKAYGMWAERMRRALPPSSKPGRIPGIVAAILDSIATQAAAARGRGQRITPEVQVPLGFVDGIVRQLQRLSALTPRKDASSDMEEVGWLIELSLRRATRSPGAAASSPPPPPPVVVPADPTDDPRELSPIERLEAQVERLAVDPIREEPPVEAPEEPEVPSQALETEDATAGQEVQATLPEQETEAEPEGPEVSFEEREPGPLEEPMVETTSDEAAAAGNGEPQAVPEIVPRRHEQEEPREDDEDPPAAGIEGAHPPIRVLLVDDEPRTLAMLAVALKGERDIEVVGLASDVSEAISIAGTTKPDVAVVDVRMPKGGGPRAARGILSLSSETRVLAYSALDERKAVLSMLEAGAVGYLVKGGPHEEVPAAIRRTMLGERPLSSEVADEVMRALTERVRLEADDRDSREQVERQVRRFLSGRDLRMAWQPIVRLHSRNVVGAEALPRFEGLEKRTPDGWFREAWRLGFGPELEGTVLEAAAGRLEQLPEELYVAVNLSPGCLVETGFLDAMQHLPWDRLVVEVTERSSVDDYAQLRAAAREIRRRGGRLAVDDAGAALASLRHIAEIEPDLVKIDERVCQNIHIDPRMHALATALISFSRELGAEIVAEGIDHRAQLDALKEIGVEFGQGPLFTGLVDPSEAPVPKRRRVRR